MGSAHETIMVGGGLGAIAILCGMVGSRIGTPLLLVFLVLGMLAGEDGPGGIPFDNFQLTYLLGSIALVVILFEGGQKTTFGMIREAALPAIALATVGVVVTAAVVGATVVYTANIGWLPALLLGALVAPTDAAAVASVLRASKVTVPPRVLAVLELESGLNDPMSVFLTVFLTHALVSPHDQGAGAAALELARQMGGGLVIGLLGGAVMVALLRALRLQQGLGGAMMLALALGLFGAAQLLETSGFLAVYLAGVLVGNRGGKASAAVVEVFEGFAWIAQIGLFLMLGLLITPHDALPWAASATFVALVLIFVARPLATIVCLAAFRVPWRHSAFIAWVGLRGAVPIYLAMIPVLAGVPNAKLGFVLAFAIVLVSLVVQGWTVGPVARMLRFSSAASTRPSVPAL